MIKTQKVTQVQRPFLKTTLIESQTTYLLRHKSRTPKPFPRPQNLHICQDSLYL